MYLLKRFRYPLLVILSILIVIFFEWNGRSSMFGQAAAWLNGLMADAGYHFSLCETGSEELERRLLETDAERARMLAELSDANDRIRRLETELGIHDSGGGSRRTGVIARVVLREPGTWHRAVTVDAGAELGVREGYIALTGRGVAGRVIQVSETTSTVLLVTGNGTATSVAVRDKNLYGIAYGDGTGNINIKSLPSHVEVRPGDEVVTSGYGGNYPEGLPVGRVRKVEPAGEKLAPVVILDPGVDMLNLYYVVLMPPYDTSSKAE